MSDDEYGRVPAGWYPDPLGLPQLRWWDNHAWTEHVSDARQPMVAQPAPTTFADDDLPSRRSRRSAESAADAGDGGAQRRPLANVLKALPAPTASAMPAHIDPNPEPAAVAPTVTPTAAPVVEPEPLIAPQPASSQPVGEQPVTAPPMATEQPSATFPAAPNPAFDIPTTESAMRDAQWIPIQEPHSAHSAGYYSAPQHSAPRAGEQWGASPYYAQHGLFQDSPPQHHSAARYGSAPGTGSAAGWGSAPGAPQYVPYVPESPVAAMRRGAVMPGGAGPMPHLHTAAAWAIALLPMLQLLLSLLVVAAFTSGLDMPIITAIWLAPIPIVIVLALVDYRSLRRRGIDRPAGWWWSVFGAPVYLIARAVRLSRVSGAGFGPVAVFLLLVGLQVGAIVAVPGLLISAVPQVFADEAASTVELTARSMGTSMDVTCTGTPPLFIGQQFRCPAVNADGATFVVTVSLQRANGWITWQVDDWGVYSMTG